MLRRFQDIISTPANTMYRAETDMKTGMGVVIDPVTMIASLPAAEMGAGFFVVDKERIATGINAGSNDLSDYYYEFVTIKAGEMVKLYAFVNQLSVFGTDQYDEATVFVEGGRVAVDANGLWVPAAVPSRYVFDKKYDDAGHELLQISVSDHIA